MPVFVDAYWQRSIILAFKALLIFEICLLLLANDVPFVNVLAFNAIILCLCLQWCFLILQTSLFAQLEAGLAMLTIDKGQ